MSNSTHFDCLIIGHGLAGSLFAHECIGRNKRVLVVSTENQYKSSTVAPGMYNPLVLKRYTLAWKSPELLKNISNYYSELESHLESTFHLPLSIKRRFFNQKEVELWYEKSDHIALEDFMSPSIEKNTNPHIDAEFGYGKVKKTGRIDTKKLLESSKSYLQKGESFLNEQFEYDKLVFETYWRYKDIIADNIIFCEGYQLQSNPYFNQLPLMGTKGELLTIHSEELNLEDCIKSGIFIMPLGNNEYRVGATFNWDQKDSIPTKEGEEELVKKLKTFIKVPFTIVSHEAGIRPTVKDRRPLLGKHSDKENLYILNGMGTRGVMLAPKAAEMMAEFIFENKELDPEWDIKRFDLC
jgi:glycine/D-amino acid oxidase-like deaminating enzyme